MDDNEGVVDTDADAAAPAAPDPVDGEVPATADGFAVLELDDRLLSAIAALGYEEPTPIQREAIPPLLAGRDLLAEAPTGTGKTAAFALPTLQRIPIGQAADGSTSALVLVPTRELAMQVAEALTKYGRGLGARVLPVYGGQPIGQQLRGLRRGVDVVVATPGRAVDHLKRGSLRFDAVSVVILDEADEMLDMGFADDLEAILSATPGRTPDGALLGDHLADHHAHRQAPPARPGADQGPCRETAGRRCSARPADRLRRAPDRQARRAVPHPRCRRPDIGPRLRADAR